MTESATSLPAPTLWPWVFARLHAAMRSAGAHPSRTVVLLPYAQLMPEAARAWGLWQARQAQAASGSDALAAAHFCPRFETTRNWAQQWQGLCASEAQAGQGGGAPWLGEVAADSLTARHLLEQAGLRAHAELLTAPLLAAAASLMPLAAAQAPQARAGWAAQMRQQLAFPAGAGRGAAAAPPTGDPLAFEAVVAQLALVWAAAAAHPADALRDPRLSAQIDLLARVRGLQPDPVGQALLQDWPGAKLEIDALAACTQQPRSSLSFRPVPDAHAEAQQAAACVLRHVEAGRVPVALAATDRVLARRIRALLDAQPLAVRDETGWKLSTTHAAAVVLGALRACAPQASADALLDSMKLAPAWSASATAALEAHLRRHGPRDASGVRAWLRASREAPEKLPDAIKSRVGGALSAPQLAIFDLQSNLQAPRPLPQWLADWRTLLQATGQWQPLLADAAGCDVLQALRLEPLAAQTLTEQLPGQAIEQRPMSLAALLRWADDALESASFVPPHPRQPQVVILPLAQLLGRAVAALVIPGADELRLPAVPEPAGDWTPAQRATLGLPGHADVLASQGAVWQQALQVPHVDLLWRQTGEDGEELLPSPWVQQSLAARPEANASAADPCVLRHLRPSPMRPPAPSGQPLPLTTLSASAYADLRACPYRFFALRLLGLQETPELEQALEKRDFGTWLHAVLRDFHLAQQSHPLSDTEARRARLDAIATQTAAALRLPEAGFLPYQTAWPALRDAYLDWLAGHEASGAGFDAAEQAIQVSLPELPGVLLSGQIDRRDRLPGGGVLVMDYKTESDTKTRNRIAIGHEDTQLAFYALLQGAAHPAAAAPAPVRAAYLNLPERGSCQLHESPLLPEQTQALAQGIAADLSRLAHGHPLAALGEGDDCEYCVARGLCRRDDWPHA